MRQLLTRNLGWKLLSLLIAIALWIAVAREPELATSLSVPVEFKKIPLDLDIGSNVPDRVHIEIRGSSGRLTHDNLANVAAILDLSDAHPGERTYTISENNLNLPSGVIFYRAVPSQITLQFDQLISRDVDVRPNYIKIPDGYHRIGEAVDPARVRIRGPEERVKNMRQIPTDPIDLSGVVSQAQFRTSVNVGDSQIRLEGPATITVTVKLEKRRDAK
ncbi:MAG TPA: CdaR family protein [Bryobacteraceae bacterium]|nr:CdaR family protein [Bryobacteraceae bacterium]